MLVYRIDGQMLSRVEVPFVVADSVNYLTAQFTFSSDWDDKTIWAQFNAPDGSQMDPVLVENGEITEDKGINLTVGKWRMSLFGVSEGEDGIFHRVTTNEADIIVRESGLKDGPRFIVEDIDEAEEIIARAGSAAIRANASADAADAAAELANEAADNANESAENADAATQEAIAATESANNAATSANEAAETANTSAANADDAADAANAAATEATTAAESANDASASASEATELANEAATAANDAADRANDAADRFDETAEEIIEQIATKQDVLVSGQNIKTVNGNSIVGAGNINIEAGVSSVNGQTGNVQLDASDVNALPSTTFIPDKTSDLTNDAGFIVNETDPTVPSWAKQQNKPTYTATEVGALPADTPIPSRTTDLQNDSGFITEDDVPVKTVNGKTGDVNLTPSDIGLGSVFTLKGSVETVADLPLTGNTIGDVYYVASESVGYIWLQDETDVERWEQLGMSIDLDGYATEEWVESRGYIEEETDPTVPEWAKQESKPTYTAQEVGALPNNTFIPSKTSDLTNDAGFITADEATPEVAIQSTQPTEEKIWIDTDDTTEYTDPSVRWDIEQNLTDSQKYRANNNIGSIVSPANPTVGKILRVKSVNPDGTMVCEWADAPSGGVSDVQINGASIVQDGVAEIPLAKYDDKPDNHAGMLSVDPYNPFYTHNGKLCFQQALDSNIANKNNGNRPLVSTQINPLVRAGLIDNPLITDTDKPLICQTIGAAQNVLDKIYSNTLVEPQYNIIIDLPESDYDYEHYLLYMYVPPNSNMGAQTANCRMLLNNRSTPYGYSGVVRQSSNSYNTYEIIKNSQCVISENIYGDYSDYITTTRRFVDVYGMTESIKKMSMHIVGDYLFPVNTKVVLYKLF